jgi:hypothetical protein
MSLAFAPTQTFCRSARWPELRDREYRAYENMYKLEI